MIKKIVYQSQVIGNVFIADTFLRRFLGYMFKKKPYYDAIMFKPCNSIHTFFMWFDIDVLFIDKDMKIITKIDALKPGKIVMPVKMATSVIEGGSGIFKDCIIGDKISVE